jgi:hypothetical protein
LSQTKEQVKRTESFIFLDISHVAAVHVSDELLKIYGSKKFSDLGFELDSTKKGFSREIVIEQEYDIDMLISQLQLLREIAKDGETEENYHNGSGEVRIRLLNGIDNPEGKHKALELRSPYLGENLKLYLAPRIFEKESES